MNREVQLMQPLSESEQKQAIALIQELPFDSDVIVAIRGLLRREAATRRDLRRVFNVYEGKADLDDTQPTVYHAEYDGD
jgi:hypothetical protein